MKKYVVVTEDDFNQSKILLKILNECKMDLKGDAIPFVAKAFNWLQAHSNALKDPAILKEDPPLVVRPLPDLNPTIAPIEAPKNPPISPSKKVKR